MKKEGETEGVFGGDKELNLALKKDEMGILKNLHPVVNNFTSKQFPFTNWTRENPLKEVDLNLECIVKTRL